MSDTVEIVTFRYNDVEYVVHGAKGVSPKPLAAVLKEIAERYGDSDLIKRGYFAKMLKMGKLEGVTLVSVEERKIEKRKF